MKGYNHFHIISVKIFNLRNWTIFGESIIRRKPIRRLALNLSCLNRSPNFCFYRKSSAFCRDMWIVVCLELITGFQQDSLICASQGRAITIINTHRISCFIDLRCRLSINVPPQAITPTLQAEGNTDFLKTSIADSLDSIWVQNLVSFKETLWRRLSNEHNCV